MRYVFLFSLLFLVRNLSSQSPAECAANAGPDQIICFNSSTGLVLNAPPTNDFQEIEWIYLGADPQVHIVNPVSFTTLVTYAGGNFWPPNTVQEFRFRVKCKDFNNDGAHDETYDDLIVTVKDDDMAQPQIIEPDGVQDGYLRVCASTVLNVTPPSAGETARVSIASHTNDNRVVYSLDTVNGLLYLDRKNHNGKADCSYTITYALTNGGCEKSASIEVFFVRPFDPDSNGIIRGRILGCPTCGDIIELRGDFPGCQGRGKWTLVPGMSAGTITYLSEDLSRGSAKVQVSSPGNYTFVYTVDNVAPCPNSTDTASCLVLGGEGFSLGPYRAFLFCDNIIPQDVYHISLPNIPNAVYSWQVLQNAVQGITISDPHSYASDIIFEQPVDISGFPIQILVRAFKIYIDVDCDGDYEEYFFSPGNTPQQNWEEYLALKDSAGLCLKECRTIMEIEFRGSPVLETLQEDVNFLCGPQGAQEVRLNQYFAVLNTAYYTDVTIEHQPPGSNLNNIDASTPLSLIAGDYRFKIELIAKDGLGQTCSKTIYINIQVREPSLVTAGTDQVKCYNEPTRLNGNHPYSGNIDGIWAQVNCNPCTITFADPKEPNTQIFMSGIDPSSLPVTLYFEWSFNNEDSSCSTSDTTEVTINPCIVPCNSNLSVVYECQNDKITFELIDSNNLIVDESVYDIVWLVSGATQIGNPVSVPNTGLAINYTINATLIYQDSIVCNFRTSGSAACQSPPSGCGITIIEMCDSCGNITVKAVDDLGNIVLPTNFEHEFRWRVFGDGPNDLSYVAKSSNPITVNPNACYELTYDHFTYAPGIPHVPGAGTLCRYEMPKQCVSVHCPEPNCEGFNFYVAGCGDDRDVTLNLAFPPNCTNVTNGLWGTLGVFNAVTNQPIDPNSVDILWKNNSMGTYVTGNLQSINTVTIRQKDGCCIWEDRYTPSCMCTCIPIGLQCERPIVKYCHENGTITYVPGIPRIAWTNVPGATGYVLEINFDAPGEEGCCQQPSSSGTIYYTVNSSPWEVPLGWNCFTIRIKAINPDAMCPQTGWSDPYQYCDGYCSPVIITCGCCLGRSNEGSALPIMVLPEAEVLAYLSMLPNQGFATIEEALIFTGWSKPTGTEFSIFPNPANQTLMIRCKDVPGHYFIRMTDLLNREFRSAEIVNQTETTLEVGNLPPGIYLIQIRNSNGGLLRVEKVFILRR